MGCVSCSSLSRGDASLRWQQDAFSRRGAVLRAGEQTLAQLPTSAVTFAACGSAATLAAPSAPFYTTRRLELAKKAPVNTPGCRCSSSGQPVPG